MSGLFASGRIVDLILALVVLEAAGLLWLRAKWRGGPPAAGLLAHLAAGAFLLLALRGALTGAPWPWIAAALLGSLAAHVADQIALWRSPRPAE